MFCENYPISINIHSAILYNIVAGNQNRMILYNKHAYSFIHHAWLSLHAIHNRSKGRILLEMLGIKLVALLMYNLVYSIYICNILQSTKKGLLISLELTNH